jgi:hypothetical protein
LKTTSQAKESDKGERKVVETRIFIDESGRKWKVTKMHAGRFKVEGDRRAGEKLHEIARSCAKKLDVTNTANGDPIERVNRAHTYMGCNLEKRQFIRYRMKRLAINNNEYPVIVRCSVVAD